MTTLESLIDAVDVLITTLEYKELLEKHVGRKNLLSLAIDLRAQYIHEKEELLYREYINSLIVSVKKELQVRSAATPVPDIDFYSLLMNAYKVEVFNSLARMFERNEQSKHRICIHIVLLRHVAPIIKPAN